MEPTTPTTQPEQVTQQTAQSEQQAQPAATAPQQPTPPTARSGSKTFLLLFLGIFLIVTGFMVYMFLTGQNSNPDSHAKIAATPTVVPTQLPTPTLSQEESEVESIDINDASPSAFPEVEKDIKGL